MSMSGDQRRAFTLDLIRLYGPTCCICGLPIHPGEESCQHIPPRSKGGVTSLETCRPAHRSCNYSVRDREYDGPAGLIHDGLAYFTEPRSET
jgi:5-methylcytosine-specific restriction endonuclease McrA